jgi:hypothetical protein
MYIVESGTKHHNPLFLKQNKHKGYGEVNKKDNILSCLSCSPLHILILKQDKHKGYEEYCLSCSPLHILILKQDKHKGYEEYCLSCSPLHILCVCLVSGLEGYGV